MKHILCVALIISALSCAYRTVTVPISQRMDTWMNLPENYIIQKWGPPTTTYPDGAGGKILSYEDSRVVTLGLGNTTYGYNSINRNAMVGSRTLTTYVQFYINKEGKTYNWRTNLPDTKERIKR